MTMIEDDHKDDHGTIAHRQQPLLAAARANKQGGASMVAGAG